jgi:hypothetical protein
MNQAPSRPAHRSLWRGWQTARPPAACPALTDAAAQRVGGGPRCAGARLGVGVGAQVAAEEGLAALQRLTELVHVGQVAVVDEVDAERRVDKEGLRLLGRRAAGRRVAHVADAHVACAPRGRPLLAARRVGAVAAPAANAPPAPNGAGARVASGVWDQPWKLHTVLAPHWRPRAAGTFLDMAEWLKEVAAPS